MPKGSKSQLQVVFDLMSVAAGQTGASQRARRNASRLAQAGLVRSINGADTKKKK